MWHPAPFHSPGIGFGSKLTTTSKSSATRHRMYLDIHKWSPISIPSQGPTWYSHWNKEVFRARRMPIEGSRSNILSVVHWYKVGTINILSYRSLISEYSTSRPFTKVVRLYLISLKNNYKTNNSKNSPWISWSTDLVSLKNCDRFVSFTFSRNTFFKKEVCYSS